VGREYHAREIENVEVLNAARDSENLHFVSHDNCFARARVVSILITLNGHLLTSNL